MNLARARHLLFLSLPRSLRGRCGLHAKSAKDALKLAAWRIAWVAKAFLPSFLLILVLIIIVDVLGPESNQKDSLPPALTQK